MKTEEQRLLDELYDRDSRGNWLEPSLEHSKTKFQKYPDAKKHQIVSFIKSGIRILGYVFIPFNLVISAILLILSEVVGIIEELV